MEYLQEIHKHHLVLRAKGHNNSNLTLMMHNTQKHQLCQSQILALTSHCRNRNNTSPKTPSKVVLCLPFFPFVADTFPDYFLNFWVTDFTVAGRFHPLQDKPVLTTLKIAVHSM